MPYRPSVAGLGLKRDKTKVRQLEQAKAVF